MWGENEPTFSPQVANLSVDPPLEASQDDWQAHAAFLLQKVSNFHLPLGPFFINNGASSVNTAAVAIAV